MSALTLAAAKLHLNITVTDHDVELQSVIDSAEAAIATRVGPLVPTTVTRRVDGGNYVLALPVTPAISLTSVTPYSGSALTLGDLYLDPISGQVTYNSSASFSASYYTVVYSAGRATCPNDLLYAVKEMVRDMWQPKRGNKASQSAVDASQINPGAALMRVERLIGPHIQNPVG